MRDLAEKTEKWQSDTMLANARKVCLKPLLKVFAICVLVFKISFLKCIKTKGVPSVLLLKAL